jgi:hypothetical protein
VRLHVRVVPILVLIGLIHRALIILTNYTYNILAALSTHYVLVYLFNDAQTQFADVPSPSGTVDATPELHT